MEDVLLTARSITRAQRMDAELRKRGITAALIRAPASLSERGCAYALRWNNMMYKDYSQAYMDLMDNDPNTQSYNKFLYLGNQIDNSNKEYYQKLFKNRKDRYRKWRDMSVFAMVGVYLISVVDAYVDASLSEFDISRDLSMKVSPAVIKERSEWTSYNPLNSSAVGLQCSLTF